MVVALTWSAPLLPNGFSASSLPLESNWARKASPLPWDVWPAPITPPETLPPMVILPLASTLMALDWLVARVCICLIQVWLPFAS